MFDHTRLTHYTHDPLDTTALDALVRAALRRNDHKALKKLLVQHHDDEVAVDKILRFFNATMAQAVFELGDLVLWLRGFRWSHTASRYSSLAAVTRIQWKSPSTGKRVKIGDVMREVALAAAHEGGELLVKRIERVLPRLYQDQRQLWDSVRRLEARQILVPSNAGWQINADSVVLPELRVWNACAACYSGVLRPGMIDEWHACSCDDGVLEARGGRRPRKLGGW